MQAVVRRQQGPQAERAARKDLHSLHEHLSDWGSALASQEEKEEEKGSSIHENIISLSQQWRPLSQSFQEYEAKKEEDSSVHEIIKVCSQKYRPLSASFQQWQKSPIQKVDKALLKDVGSLSLALNDCDDPFSATLDDILECEEDHIESSSELKEDQPKNLHQKSRSEDLQSRSEDQTPKSGSRVKFSLERSENVFEEQELEEIKEEADSFVDNDISDDPVQRKLVFDDSDTSMLVNASSLIEEVETIEEKYPAVTEIPVALDTAYKGDGNTIGDASLAVNKFFYKAGESEKVAEIKTTEPEVIIGEEKFDRNEVNVALPSVVEYGKKQIIVQENTKELVSTSSSVISTNHVSIGRNGNGREIEEVRLVGERSLQKEEFVYYENQSYVEVEMKDNLVVEEDVQTNTGVEEGHAVSVVTNVYGRKEERSGDEGMQVHVKNAQEKIVVAEGLTANEGIQDQEANLEMEQTNAEKVVNVEIHEHETNVVDVNRMNERRASEQVVKSIIWEDVMSSVMGGVRKSETSSSSSSSSSDDDLSETKSPDDDCSSSASSGSFPLPPPSLFPPKSPKEHDIYNFNMGTDDSGDNEEFPPPPNAPTLSPTFPPPPPPTPAVVTNEKFPKLDVEVLRVGKDLIHVESYEPKVHTHVETLPANIEVVTLGRDILHLEVLDEEKAKVIGKHSVETVCEEVVTIPEGVDSKEMPSNEEGTKMEEVFEENKYLMKTSEVVLGSAENLSQTEENVQEICEGGNVSVLAEVLDNMDSNVKQEKGSVIGEVHVTGGSFVGMGHVLAGGDGQKDVFHVEATSDDQDYGFADKHKHVVSIKTTTSDEHESIRCNVSEKTAKEGSDDSDDHKSGVVTVGKDDAKKEGFKVDDVAVTTGFDNNDGVVSIKEMKTDQSHEQVSNKHPSDETNKEEGFKVGVDAVVTGYGFDDQIVSVGEGAGRGGFNDKTTRTSHKVDRDSHCKVVSYGHRSHKFFLADSSSNGGLLDDSVDGVSLYAVNDAEKTDPDVEVCDDVATKEVVDTNHKDPVGTSGGGKQNHRDVVGGNENFRMEIVQGASKENIETTKTEHVSAIKIEEITVSDEFKSKASSFTSEEKTISVTTTLASKIEPKPINSFPPKVSIKKTPKVKSVFSAFEKIKVTDDSSSEDDVPKLASHSKFLFDQKRSMFESSPQQSAPKTTKPFFKPGKLKFKTEQNVKVFETTETLPTKSLSKTTETSPVKKQVKFQRNVGKLSDKKSDSGIETRDTLSDRSVKPPEDKAASIEKTEPKIPPKPVQNKPLPPTKPTSPKSGVNLFTARPFTSPTFGSSPTHPRPISPPAPKSVKPFISPKPTLPPKPSSPPLPPVIPPLPDVQDEEMDNMDEGIS